MNRTYLYTIYGICGDEKALVNFFVANQYNNPPNRLAFWGHMDIQCAHDMHNVLSIFLGLSIEMAFTGHCLAQSPHLLQVLLVLGTNGTGLIARYGRLPLITN